MIELWNRRGIMVARGDIITGRVRKEATIDTYGMGGNTALWILFVGRYWHRHGMGEYFVEANYRQKSEYPSLFSFSSYEKSRSGWMS